MAEHRSYLCIDLKSFYASVECIDRGLDPLTTPLVVADPTRTNKTICLAVSPALKAHGVPGRCRVFEIPAHLKYIMAPPRMARYIERSADVYGVYLRWIAKEDIHVYSIDEAFFDITNYLNLYHMSARELGQAIRDDVFQTTGLPATCGLGTNLYLAKIALDIQAKHTSDAFGELDEQRYRDLLWSHRPLTDFWRVGPGIARRLDKLGIHTMGQLAMADPNLIYSAIGIDAEILIDHAWGIEPTTIADIKAYQPSSHSNSSAQVFGCAYTPAQALTVIKEMADSLALSLAKKSKAAAGLSVWVGYEAHDDERDLLRSAMQQKQRSLLSGLQDSASERFIEPTNSSQEFRALAAKGYERCVDTARLIKRVGISANDVVDSDAAGIQMSLLADRSSRQKEVAQAQAVNDIREKFGKNAMLRGMDLLPHATARQRNAQIGGHRSGTSEDEPRR